MLLATTIEDGAVWTAAALADFERAAVDLDVRTRQAEPLRRHTSFGVGGPCPLMAFPERPEQVISLAQWAGQRSLRCRALGGGSNLLVRDEGVPEPVINTTRLTAGTTTHPDHVTFAAGLPTAQALHRTVEAGLSGLVWAAGLPGTLGGAAAGNAGCWGGDMATSTNYLDVIDGEGQAHRVQGVDLAWAYRELKLPATIAEPWCIVAISIQVESDNPATLRVDYEQLQARKRALQPIGVRNSGCIFRNPEGGAAGAILDAAGCKGQQVGGAVVSSQHANFIVNDGDATAADIETLIAQLVATAREHQDVVLEPEIRRW